MILLCLDNVLYGVKISDMLCQKCFIVWWLERIGLETRENKARVILIRYKRLSTI